MAGPNIHTLDAEHIRLIHDEVLAETGGLPGVCPDKSLEATIFRIDNHIFYGGNLGLYDIAALYATAIAQGHVFNDGNKRTAMVAMLAFLELNGVDIVVPDQCLVDLMIRVAEKQVSREDLALWLKRSSRPSSR